jgi:hypothetical protein
MLWFQVAKKFHFRNLGLCLKKAAHIRRGMQMRKQWKVAATAALLFGASTTAWGMACGAGSLNDYFAMGSASCSNPQTPIP